MKKDWRKPQLAIVARGSAEENVLDSCKVNGGAIQGPSTVAAKCYERPTAFCSYCYGPTPS